MALTTAVRAKRYNTLAGVNATLLNELLEAASDLAENFCSRAFASAVYAPETYDGLGDAILFLRNMPITDVASVLIRDPDGSEEDIDNAADDQFVYDPDAGILRFDPNCTSDHTAFTLGFQNVDVTYTGGYAAVPDAVQQAVIIIAIGLYSEGSFSGDPGLESEKLGEYQWKRQSKSTTDNQGYLPNGARQLLTPYCVRTN